MKQSSLFSYISRVFVATVVMLSMITAGFTAPSAAALSPAKAKVTFTFDDARQSSYTQAAPILAKYGLRGTLYATTGCIGMTTIPNTCHAANDVRYLTWAQVTALQNTYKWEVGSHSVTHPYMASVNPDDGQPKMLTQAQIEREVSQSKTDLAAHGINAQSFASPYGDYNQSTLQTIAKYYLSHRAFAEQKDNVYPYNERLLNNMQVQYPVTTTAVKAKIDYAIANNLWLVLTFHDILPNSSTDPNQYQWAAANLDAVASYVKSKIATSKIQNVNVTEGLVRGTSLLAAPIANGKFGNGWVTDNATGFSLNTSNFGSYPEPANSIKISSTTLQSHLFSHRVPVDASSIYVLKNYLNVTAISRGEVGFYIDEYDASGNWVSGQYKTREVSKYLENLNFIYQPSSVRVKTASLQVYTTPLTGIIAYLDNMEWIKVASTTSPQADVMTGGSFTNSLSPWTTDNAVNIKLDANNNGAPANQQYSVAFSNTAGSSHLFSPLLAITPGSSYYLETYLKLISNSGEIGFYVDEYDTSGAWISGQYKLTASSLTAGDVAFNYTPSTVNVAKVRVQIIVSGTSISGYLDNVRLWKL